MHRSSEDARRYKTLVAKGRAWTWRIYFWGELDLKSGVKFLCLTCLVSKNVFAGIKVVILWDRPKYRAGAWGLLHLISCVKMLRAREHVCDGCLAVLLPLVGAQRHQQDGLCALCCSQGHVHPGVTILIWQPQNWACFWCMNLYLASFTSDSLCWCFFVSSPPWFGGFMGFSLCWSEFHSLSQAGWHIPFDRDAWQCSDQTRPRGPF